MGSLRFAALAALTQCGPGDVAPDLSMTFDSAAGQAGPVLFAKAAIRKAFPGFDVSEGRLESLPDEPKEVFILSVEGAPVFYVDHGWQEPYSFSAFTTSPAVAGPEGMVVGETRLSDLPEERQGDCALGQNYLAETMVCLFKGTDTYRFRALFDPSDGGYTLREMRVYYNRPVQ